MLLDTKLLKKAGVFAVVSGELTVLIVGGYWLGLFLEQKWHLHPVTPKVLAILGFVISIWRLYGFSKSWMKE